MHTMSFCLPLSVAMQIEDRDLVEVHVSSMKDDGTVDVELTGDDSAVAVTAAEIRSAIAH
jgi:hypothetical protein